MKIVCFSINPLFQDHVTGGASKHLVNLCHFLEEEGHEVVVLCAEADTNQQPFMLGKHIQVKPELPFHLPFPQPYQIAPGDLALICESVARELATADRFYIHDGELLLPFLYSKIPTISSFRDNYYPESILGSFLTQADAIIAVSDYSAKVLKASAGRVIPDLTDRIHTVLNGIDTSLYQFVDPTSIFQRFGLDSEVNQIILHPHRPEDGKGLFETILVVEKLVKDYGFTRIRVLVPDWLEEMNGAMEDKFHEQINAELQRRGLGELFIFHPWLRQEEMPLFYSAASLTLCLGNLVEAFGNAAYESLACGTPSIVARVGVHRTQLPDALIEKVDFGDVDSAAQLAADILQNHTQVQGERLQRILNYFPIEKQLKTYSEIITSGQKLPPLQSKPLIITPDTHFQLAPWCYLSSKGVYHDYRAQYFSIPELETWLSNFDQISLKVMVKSKVTWENLRQWYQMGILIPVMG